MRRGAALMAVLVIGLLVAGCGGSKATTVAQFKTDVDGVCQKLKSSGSLAKAKAIVNTKAADDAKAAELYAIEAPYFKQLAAIKPPPNDATAEEMHDAYTAVSGAVQTVLTDLKSAGKNTSALDNAGTTIHTNESILARDYTTAGVTACE